MVAKPVFLHSSWRSSSTYVWAKYRPSSRTYCYFEPLAEHLTQANEAMLGGVSWSYANHPLLDAPYRAEFLSLLDPHSGIKGFPPQGPYPRYRLEPDEDYPELVRYFDILTAHANSYDRFPVYGLVRTALRVGWCVKNLAGTHVYILRDPRKQFVSMMHQYVKGTPYFMERGMVILGNNLDDPILSPVIDRVGLPRFDGDPALRDQFYLMRARDAETPTLYAIFYYLHVLAVRRMRDACDWVIDVDVMAVDPAARLATEQRMFELTGVEASFADCRPESYDAYLLGDNVESFFGPIERDMIAVLDQTLRAEKTLDR